MSCRKPFTAQRVGPGPYFHRVLFSLAGLAIMLVSSAPVVAQKSALWGLIELGRGHKTFSEGAGGCVSPAEQRKIQQDIAKYHARFGSGAAEGRQTSAVTAPALYPFFPQAGNLYDDLFSGNFVDLDNTAAIKDWDCTDWTYDGHQGNDVTIHSFGEQDLGVPIFAALDGTVVSLHDGEFDKQTEFSGALANYVVLHHGGTHYTWYYHFRKNSITVAVNQQVKAGTALGMTGSSGYSTYPHLHFQTMFNNQVFEPYQGGCQSGASGWVNQTPIRRQMYLEDFLLTDKDPADYPPLPYDIPRAGTYVMGTPPIALRFLMHNLPASSSVRFRFTKPDGTLRLDGGNVPLGNAASRVAYYWFRYQASLDTPGTWHVEMLVNGTSVITAPIEVVSSVAAITNRAPVALDEVTFDPPQPKSSDVVFCRLPRGTVLHDPDYDIVRYRYQWKLNGTTVRDVTTAGRADAIPAGTLQSGGTLLCTVTPSDGVVVAEPASATTTVAVAGCRVSGTVKLKNAGLAGVTVSNGSTTTTTAANGSYSFANVTGTMTITPMLAGYSFLPVSQSVTVTTADKTVPVFKATVVPVPPVPPVLTGFTLASTVKGGKAIKGTLTLNSSVHAAVKVVVTANNAAIKGKTVAVAKNKPSAAVSLATKKVQGPVLVTVTASYAGVEKTVTVMVTP